MHRRYDWERLHAKNIGVASKRCQGTKRLDIFLGQVRQTKIAPTACRRSVRKRPEGLYKSGAFYCARRVTNSEFELQSELHLARRTRVSGWKSGVGDYAKGSAPYLGNSPRLTKVGMVEQIEDF